MNIQEEIRTLKKERNALILAHYYVPGPVQEIADVVGDSFALSQKAADTDADVLVFAGVSFMGESAKILSPDKTVLLPDAEADCPMAHMATEENIRKLKKQYPDLAVVCYINSTARLKALSDVCVTSSNALKIVRALPNRNIYFIPDKNLGQYVAGQVPEKNIILNDGYCPIHHSLTPALLLEAKKAHPEAQVLMHPECPPKTLPMADYVGSTAGILAYARQSSHKEFLVATEEGVLWQLQRENPGKQFYSPTEDFCCPGMKLITLEKVRDALKNNTNPVEIEESLRLAALRPLKRMLQLAAQRKEQ
ncbi:MAG TPA: quinolinate synthase NadA [Candidatus Pullilachnospira intestinigallinarum]|nr:quinolinate synthase NadA [Candidatus Pullilachnospira intestinigallinarum]